MLLVVGACAWVVLRATPAVPMAPEPEVIAGDAVAAAPVAAPVAEPVVPPAKVAAVAVATIDDGAAEGVAVASAKPAAPTDTVVPNRLSLSVDELVRAGLAQDVAEDLVESLNSMAMRLEQPPFTLFLRQATVQIVLALAPQLAQSVANGAVAVTRSDSRLGPPVMGGGMGGGSDLYRDGFIFGLTARRGSLAIVVRERVVPAELWQRYVAEIATKNVGSIEEHIGRAKGR